MNYVTRFAMLGTLVIAGCSAAPPAEDNEGVTSSDLDLANSCAGHARATLTEVVQDYANHAAKAGVTVCAEVVHGHDDVTDNHQVCGQTDANGVVALEVKSCKDVRVTFASDGYVSANQLLRIRGDVATGTRMIATALASQLAQFLGSTLDLTKAQPVFTTYTPAEVPLAGVELKIRPASGTLYYVATNGAPSAALTSTTAAGIAGVLNADVDSYIVKANPPPNMHCDIGPYVPGPTPNSIQVEGIAGSAGEAAFHCE